MFFAWGLNSVVWFFSKHAGLKTGQTGQEHPPQYSCANEGIGVLRASGEKPMAGWATLMLVFRPLSGVPADCLLCP